MSKCTFMHENEESCAASAVTMTPPLCYAHMRDVVNDLNRKRLELLQAMAVVDTSISRLCAEANMQKPVEIGTPKCICGKEFRNYLNLWDHVSEEDDSSYHAVKLVGLQSLNGRVVTPRTQLPKAPVKRVFDPNNVF